MSYPITIPFSPVDPVTGLISPPNGALLHPPRVALGKAFANAVYTFFVTGSSTPANVYQDGALTIPFSPTGQVTADAFGRCAAIYLDPTVTYKVTLTSSAIPGGTRTCDPYQPAMATTGTSTAGIGLRVNSQNEYTVATPNSGGSGVTLTLAAPPSGAALALVGDAPGTPLLVVNNSATTGAQTATFSATNRPGTATAGPVGWLPIQCDGVLYYAPMWFDNNFQRYFNFGTAINGSSISALTVEFNSNGGYTLTGVGATAVPGQWAAPVQVGIGSNYWLNLTQTSGAAAFTQSSGAVGSWTNIGAGLTIGSSTSYASAAGTYKLSSSSGGTPLVGSGTISLPQSGTINGSVISAASVQFDADGSYTLTGVGASASPSQWATPTQAGLGSSYWLNLTKSSGLAGANFAQSSGSVGSWTNISTGLTITSPSGNSTVGGTFQLSSASGGSPVVASGSISLTGTGGAWSQTLNNGALQFATNGTLGYAGGSAPSNWYSPTTGSIGSSYYLYMTTTGGTNGVTIGGISQSAYTALTSGLNIYATAVPASAATGYASGTYSISTSASAAGVVATGTWTIGNQTSCPQAQNQTSAALTGTAETFNTNGTLSGGGNWYLPPTTSIGNSYYVMINNFTSSASGGSFSLSGGMTSGTWYALSSAQSFTVSSSGSPVGGWNVTYQISSSAGGSPILAQGSISNSNAG